MTMELRVKLWSWSFDCHSHKRVDYLCSQLENCRLAVISSGGLAARGKRRVEMNKDAPRAEGTYNRIDKNKPSNIIYL